MNYDTHMVSSKTRLAVSAYAICVFIFVLGSNGMRNFFGWIGFSVIAAILVILGVVVFLRAKPPLFRWYRLPAPLYWFLGWIFLSIIWSQYRLETTGAALVQTATTLVAVVLAFVLTWHELLRTLGTALRYLLGGSLLFELFVSVFIRHKIIQPIGAELAETSDSKLLLWSRNLLFHGGPIQGINANSALLGFLALLGLIIFAIQLRAGLVRPVQGWFWVLVSCGTLLLTRSATVWIALFAVLVVLGLALLARRLGPERRLPLYLGSLAVLIVGGALAFIFRTQIFHLLGKSSDMTGRGEIWAKVTDHALQHPWLGWGWISYWAPWIEPYASLDKKNGIAVMSAHSAWLDVWLQLGIIGVLVFLPLVVLTYWRVWFRAIDPPRRGYGPPLPYATSALWPVLLLTALVVQSLTESRLLIEGNWVLLIILAVKSRFDYAVPFQDAEPRRLPWRKVPIPRELPRQK